MKLSSLFGATPEQSLNDSNHTEVMVDLCPKASVFTKGAAGFSWENREANRYQRVQDQ